MREREKLENISLTYALNDASNKKGRKEKRLTIRFSNRSLRFN